MITLTSLVGALTILILSAKTYKDLQSRISEVNNLHEQLEKKLKETSGTINAEVVEEELI